MELPRPETAGHRQIKSLKEYFSAGIGTNEAGMRNFSNNMNKGRELQTPSDGPGYQNAYESQRSENMPYSPQDADDRKWQFNNSSIHNVSGFASPPLQMPREQSYNQRME